MAKLRIGVLASGRGSNLQAILDACREGRLNGEVVVVASDVESAEALERARKAGITAVHVRTGKYRTRLEPEAERELARTLLEHEVDVVALAGFMRILHDDFLRTFEGRTVNIHPSLLPSFPGLDAQGQAHEYGVKRTGATVHFVDPGIDTGPVILQEAVEVLDDDTRDSLAARILEVEHRIYPEALQLIAEGRLRVSGRRVAVLPAAADQGRSDGEPS